MPTKRERELALEVAGYLGTEDEEEARDPNPDCVDDPNDPEMHFVRQTPETIELEGKYWTCLPGEGFCPDCEENYEVCLGPRSTGVPG